jgi:hypothetical protein|tara:strand:+ start:36 stop:446 length:411 start_codon:yes stop_codon:yes gene_type:complete
MRVVDLDGNASVWKIKGHIVKNNDSRPRSKHHLKARALLKEMFPTCQLIEEVSIAPRKGEVLYLDFYIPLHSLCVEVHGEQHYKFIPHYHGNMMGFAKSKKRDREKEEWCELNGIRIVELPFSEEEYDWRNRIKES